MNKLNVDFITLYSHFDFNLSCRVVSYESYTKIQSRLNTEKTFQRDRHTESIVNDGAREFVSRRLCNHWHMLVILYLRLWSHPIAKENNYMR